MFIWLGDPKVEISKGGGRAINFFSTHIPRKKEKPESWKNETTY